VVKFFEELVDLVVNFFIAVFRILNKLLELFLHLHSYNFTSGDSNFSATVSSVQTPLHIHIIVFDNPQNYV